MPRYSTTSSLVVQPSEPVIPTGRKDGSTVEETPDNHVCRLIRSQLTGVQPPADASELALHVGLKPLVSVEVEPVLGSTIGVTVLAYLDAGREHDQPHRSRRHQSDEEVEFGSVCQDRVH